jgi:L-asparaginase II
MGIIRWMCAAGDTQVAWSEADTESMERARRMIDQAFAEGRGVFAIDEDGVGVRLKAFDPRAREIVVIPQIKGG